MFDLDLNPSIQAPAEPPELIGAGATFTGIYEGAKTRASYLFVVFLASEWKYRLYRCPTCGRYKLLNKAPRSQYKGRIFCRKHQQAQAARRITQEKRERAKEIRARAIKSVLPGPQVFVTQVSVARADPDSASTHSEVEPDRPSDILVEKSDPEQPRDAPHRAVQSGRVGFGSNVSLKGVQILIDFSDPTS